MTTLLRRAAGVSPLREHWRGRGAAGAAVSAPSAGLRPPLAVLLVLAAALVMHGCHGRDDDHEPTVVPPRELTP